MVTVSATQAGTADYLPAVATRSFQVITRLPVITVQPQSVTVAHRGHGALSTTATGDFLSYQWYIGAPGDTSHPVAGATGTLLVSPVASTAASYWVRVSNAFDFADSTAATVTPSAPVACSLFATGRNSSGQLGDGTTTNRSVPVHVADDVISVSIGASHSLFIKTDGSLWGMGANNLGQLGDGTSASRSAPIQIATDVVAVSAVSSQSFFIKTDGSLWRTGAEVIGADDYTPVQIATDVASVAGGGNHVLIIKTDGSLWVAGANSSGQLGDGTTFSRATPVQIASGVASASGGHAHSLFVKTDGSLWGMGDNSRGQLGNVTASQHSIPVKIFSSVVSAAAGSDYSLFVRTNGTLWGTGANTGGQLGLLPSSNRSTPDQVATGVVSVSAGLSHTLFAKTDGTLWAMGSNSYGELGDGSVNYRTTPVSITTSTTALSVAAGAYHSLFRVLPVTAPSAFESWAQAAGLNGVSAAADADPDFDGLPNLLEYVFALSPTQPATTSASRPTSEFQQVEGVPCLVYTHRRLKAAGAYCSYFSSTDLAAWTEVAQSPVIVDPDLDGDGTVELVSLAVPLGDHPALFIKLAVSE
jgi:alpha-tubulin suppressor-like RCC1 family protein